MQGMRVAAEPLSAPPYATECTMTLSGIPDQKFLLSPQIYLEFAQPVSY